MRDGENRAFGYAVLASILLHALFLLALPSLRGLSAQLPPPPGPLVARLVEARPAPLPAGAVDDSRQPSAPLPQPVVPRPIARPAPARAAAAVAQPASPKASPAPAPASVDAAPATSGPLARVDPRPEAPGRAASDLAVLERYRLQIVTAAARFKRYPRSAIDNNWEGEVVVRMTIGADGRIAALGIKSSSGHEILDRQALEMFKTAKPYVLLPAELAGKEFELELRAIYSLKDQRSG